MIYWGKQSTGEDHLLMGVLVTHKGAFLVILTYEEVSDDVYSIWGKWLTMEFDVILIYEEAFYDV